MRQDKKQIEKQAERQVKKWGIRCIKKWEEREVKKQGKRRKTQDIYIGWRLAQHMIVYQDLQGKVINVQINIPWEKTETQQETTYETRQETRRDM